MTSDRPDVARLIGLGFDVFPCHGLGSPKVKQPKTGRDWRDGPPAGGWEFADGDLIGVNLPRGTVVLDIDDAEKFKASGLELVSSAFSPTRRDGGIHVFYQTDVYRDVPQVTEGSTLGYDTRVGGLGYVIAWHPEDWDSTDTWQPAPEWLYERHHPSERVTTTPGAILVTRLDILSFLGTFPARGIALSKNAFYAILVAKRDSGEITAADPKRPWTDEDLRELAAEATKWKVAIPEPVILMNGEQGDRIRNIRDYLADVPLTIPWFVDHFAYEHGITIVAGAPKAGKSTLAFSLMEARETGNEWIGFNCEPGPTLLVTEEGGVPVRHKGGMLRDLDVYDRKASGGEPFEATLKVIADWCELHPGGLVFIDTLAVWAGVEDENSSAEMTKAIDLIRLRVSEPYPVAVVLVHHARKSGGKDGEGIRGSGAILASVDHVIELRRHESHDTQRWIDVMSRVLPGQEHWLIDWDGMNRAYTRITDEIEQQRDLDSINAEVARIPSNGDGVTQKQVHALGISRHRLEHLVNVGRVSARKGISREPTLYWGIPPVPFGAEHAAYHDDDE